jgi:hypothetical protein
LETGHRYLLAASETFGLFAVEPQIGWHPRRKHPDLESLRVFKVSGLEKMLVLNRRRADGIEILRMPHGSRNFGTLLRREDIESANRLGPSRFSSQKTREKQNKGVLATKVQVARNGPRPLRVPLLLRKLGLSVLRRGKQSRTPRMTRRECSEIRSARFSCRPCARRTLVEVVVAQGGMGSRRL